MSNNRFKLRYFSETALPYWCILLTDCFLILLASLVATYIISGGNGVASHFWEQLLVWVCLLPVFVLGMRIFHTYSGILRYATTSDFIRSANALITGFAIVAILKLALPNLTEEYEPRWSTLAVMFPIALMAQWGTRIFVKHLYHSITISRSKKPVFIYGAKEGAIAIANSLMSEDNKDYNVVGFISLDNEVKSKYLMGTRIYQRSEDIIALMKEHHCRILIVSPIQAERFRNDEVLVNQLVKEKFKILMASDPEKWDPTKQIEQTSIRNVEVEDLLPRDKITVDMNAIGEMLKERKILITGAAGSIGSEMVRQVSKYSPAQLVLVDQAETPMHDVRLWMKNNHPELKAETIVGSINNATHMEKIFAEHKPEYVFHAAAYKHVPMMEDNPAMAIQNNTYGTRVIADLAVKYGTKKFVMISTDKAVNPTNVMGCSKRICEIYCQSLNRAILNGFKDSEKVPEGFENAQTQFITTRFGNVLGSNGSVIPIFRKQIQKGGPVTVTHPDIIRFFMLIPEACQLVLEAGTMGKGGEIFVFDMGKPVRIADLAQRMIDLSGAKGVEVKFTGLRDGEKLYEEVLNDAEQTIPTHHPKIKIAQVREYDYDLALRNEEELHALSLSYDDMAIVKKMKEIVPEYKSQHSKYEALDK